MNIAILMLLFQLVESAQRDREQKLAIRSLKMNWRQRVTIGHYVSRLA